MKRCAEHVEFHELDSCSIPENHGTSFQEYAELYRHMALIRQMETYLDGRYAIGCVRGFCHLAVGQEGLYAVLMKLLETGQNDKVITSYRCHAAAYATGCTIREIICENLGLKEGNCRGKGGSMHLYNDRLYGGHGIVGAQVPLGTGIAFSIKYKGYMHKSSKGLLESSKSDRDFVNKSKKNFVNYESDGVCFTIYGDGATNQGQVYESFNMAKIYNLPVVFIVENNGYGMYTPVENVSVDDCFYKRGYGVPGLRICDTNITLLKSTLEFARDYSMKNGPIIVQVDTYRICGHSAEDKVQFYKMNGEKDEEAQMDCLKNLEDLLAAKMTEESLAKLKKDIEEEFCKEIKDIDVDERLGEAELYTDLYYN